MPQVTLQAVVRRNTLQVLWQMGEIAALTAISELGEISAIDESDIERQPVGSDRFPLRKH